MQEDVQGILSKGKVESHHTQKVWTNVPFRVSARALVKKQKEKDRDDCARINALCRAKLAQAKVQK